MGGEEGAAPSRRRGTARGTAVISARRIGAPCHAPSSTLPRAVVIALTSVSWHAVAAAASEARSNKATAAALFWVAAAFVAAAWASAAVTTWSSSGVGQDFAQLTSALWMRVVTVRVTVVGASASVAMVSVVTMVTVASVSPVASVVTAGLVSSVFSVVPVVSVTVISGVPRVSPS